MKLLQYESLHTHTSDSDGKQTHLEVLKSAEKYGFKTVAFTEHDSLPNKATLKKLKDYSGPVNWLVGIELTSKMPRSSGRFGNFHVLGLFTDPHHKGLNNHCSGIKQGRVQRMQHFVKHLTSLGLKLTEQDCMEFAGDSPIGSPHIVMAVQKYPQNQDVIEKLRQSMKNDAMHNTQTAEAYQMMLKDKPELHVYNLFMKHSSYIPMPPAPSDALLPLEDSVELIRSSGGIAIMAHWFFNKNVFPNDQLEECIATGVLDGLETDLANAISYKAHLQPDIQFLQDLVKRYDVIETLGADSHSEADLEHYSKSRLAAKSVGMTAGIIKRIKPSLEWTNIDAKTL